MKRWQTTSKGGVILRTGRNDWLARPFNKVGMTTIQGFSTEVEARQYADTPA